MTAARETLEQRWLRMSQIEEQLRNDGVFLIAGVDEAGRGPLAGPVAAAAVILPPDVRILGLNDSKKLSERQRLALEPVIKETAVAWNVTMIDHRVIDRINILQATKLGMRQAVHALDPAAVYL
ncbi:MAG: ribonuclease HII, partial [Firmicutes bacterium]|nr:ribonuclease HII [Bacillota bacterium]